MEKQSYIDPTNFQQHASNFMTLFFDVTKYMVQPPIYGTSKLRENYRVGYCDFTRDANKSVGYNALQQVFTPSAIELFLAKFHTVYNQVYNFYKPLVDEKKIQKDAVTKRYIDPFNPGFTFRSASSKAISEAIKALTTLNKELYERANIVVENTQNLLIENFSEHNNEMPPPYTPTEADIPWDLID